MAEGYTFRLVNESDQTYHQDGRWGPLDPKRVVSFPSQKAAKNYLRIRGLEANVRTTPAPTDL